MRVALVYTGLLRSWQQCKGNHYENVWMPNNPDLYFFTDKNPMVGMEDREAAYCYERTEWVKDQNVNWYPDPFKPHRYDARKAPENTICQTFRQWHCGMIGFHLVPQGYDVYVRIRPDIIFNSPINFSNYDCSGNKIYIPQGHDYGGVNDQFAFGNHHVMKTYYSVYQNCHDLYADGVLFHSETMQKENLLRNGIEIVRYGSPQVNIVR